MNRRFCIAPWGRHLSCWLTLVCLVASAHAELNTDEHVGGLGDGETVVNADGSITIFDEGGVGDIWTEGDDFQYYYDSTPWAGDFSATVRVVSSVEDVGGRWGKAGLMIRSDPLEIDSAFIMAEQHTGNERLIDPPVDLNGDVPRLAWRAATGDFGDGTIGRHDFLNAPAPLPPEPDGVPVWLRIDRSGEVFTAWWSLDDNGTPAEWQDEFSPEPLPNLADEVTIGLAYSAHGSMPFETHGVTFDNYSVVSQLLVGDFNKNGILDAPDVDDLTGQSALGNNPTPYDLDNDSLVNSADVKVWIKDLFNSWIGDANLDGEFGTDDLVVVLASGTYEVDTNAVWSTGDFNGDGRTNTTDLVVALADGGYENGLRAATAAVPEPTSFALLTVALGGFLACVRRSRDRHGV